jgi:hypothetical protein
MSIKKSLLTLAVAAMATMAFAAPAMGSGGALVDHNGTEAIKAGTILHTVGWARFSGGLGTFECHVTSNVEATGSTGETGTVTKFEPPETEKCTGTGGLAGCKLKTHKTDNLPYHATVTGDGRIHITGNIVLTIEYSNCLAKTVHLTFSDITLTPKKTGTTTPAPTGTENTIGPTAALNETIAGFEIDASSVDTNPVRTGTAHVTNIFGGKSTEEVGAAGEFELTKDTRCTYEIKAL